MLFRPFLPKLAIIIFSISLASVSAECPKPERLADDDIWCINDRVAPNYVLDARNLGLRVETKNNGIFWLNLRGVKVAVEKRLGSEIRAEIIGYNPPSFRNPHRITIFVGTKERRENLELEIEKTRKKFESQCFHCVLSERPPENRSKH